MPIDAMGYVERRTNGLNLLEEVKSPTDRRMAHEAQHRSPPATSRFARPLRCRTPGAPRCARRPGSLARPHPNKFGVALARSPGRSRTYVANPDSKSGGPCRQTNRGTTSTRDASPQGYLGPAPLPKRGTTLPSPSTTVPTLKAPALPGSLALYPADPPRKATKSQVYL